MRKRLRKDTLQMGLGDVGLQSPDRFPSLEFPSGAAESNFSRRPIRNVGGAGPSYRGLPRPKFSAESISRWRIGHSIRHASSCLQEDRLLRRGHSPLRFSFPEAPHTSGRRTGTAAGGRGGGVPSHALREELREERGFLLCFPSGPARIVEGGPNRSFLS